MAVTDDQYNSLLSRMRSIEETLNDLITAIDNYVTTSQVNQVLTIVQQDVSALSEEVSSLNTRVDDIEKEPRT